MMSVPLVPASPPGRRRVAPDFGAIDGTALADVLGALLTIALILAVATIVVCAVVWAFAEHAGHWQHAGRARAGLLTALGAAAVTGGALAWANWLLGLGATL